MGDGPAERGHLGGFFVDVNELVIAGRIGKTGLMRSWLISTHSLVAKCSPTLAAMSWGVIRVPPRSFALRNPVPAALICGGFMAQQRGQRNSQGLCRYGTAHPAAGHFAPPGAADHARSAPRQFDPRAMELSPILQAHQHQHHRLVAYPLEKQRPPTR